MTFGLLILNVGVVHDNVEFWTSQCEPRKAELGCCLFNQALAGYFL
jgi:hypothetical protein